MRLILLLTLIFVSCKNKLDIIPAVAPISPVLDELSDLNVTEGEAMTTVDAGDSGNDYDGENDELTYNCYFDQTLNQIVAAAVSCDLLPGVTSFNKNTGVFNWTPSIGSNGDYEIIVIASDKDNHSDGEIFEIKVLPVGSPKILALNSSSPGDGVYGVGEDIDIIVTFDQIITTASSTLILDTGATASFLSGSGSTTVTYRYSVLNGQNSLDLNVTGFNTVDAMNAGSLPVNNTLPVGNDLANNQSIVIDTIAPSVNSLIVNNGATSTYNKNILLTMNASDLGGSKVGALCIKINDNTEPILGDSCWKTLASIAETPAVNYTLIGYPLIIGPSAGLYNLYVWARDEVDNISSLSNSGVGTASTDLYSINYLIDPPPLINELIASSNDSPSTPLTSFDTTVTLGSDVFIKWAVVDDEPIPAGGIKLSYSYDGETFSTPIDLNNAINGSCTLSGSQTGCYHWSSGSPSNNYYKIRLYAYGTGISYSLSDSNALNTDKVNFLSGNTSLGIGAAASSAILLGRRESSFKSDGFDNQAFVVASNGDIFFNYENKGLAYVSSADGRLEILVKQTGTSTGDGGNAADATTNQIHRVLLDYDGNVLFYEAGSTTQSATNKVRRINRNTDPWTIETIIGGGSNRPIAGELATDAQVTLHFAYGREYRGSIQVLPDGKIYFREVNDAVSYGVNQYYYDPIDGMIKILFARSGFGTGDNTGDLMLYDQASCPSWSYGFTFNKNDSSLTQFFSSSPIATNPVCGNNPFAYHSTLSNLNVITGAAEAPHPEINSDDSLYVGMDGRLYQTTGNEKEIQRFNSTTQDWEIIAGTSENGRCDDGTPALSCPMSALSLFVSKFGRVYFLDLGIIRYIDDDNTIQTLIGQPRNFGVGQNPLSARYSKINFFEVSSNDVYVKNELENQIVKFSLAGGNLSHIAGDTISAAPSIGSNATATSLVNGGWSIPVGFKVFSNRLYHQVSSGAIGYINLTDNLWYSGGALSVQRPSYIGSNGSELLIYDFTHYGSSGNDVRLEEIEPTTPTQTKVFGRSDILLGLNNYYCLGMTGTTCTLNYTLGDAVQTGAGWDPTTSSWILVYRDSAQIVSLPQGGGVTSLLSTADNDIISHAYRRDGGDQYLYYCADDGLLYERDIDAVSESVLTFPTPNISCAGHVMFYDSSRDTVLFIYQENGLYGIAEYDVSP